MKCQNTCYIRAADRNQVVRVIPVGLRGNNLPNYNNHISRSFLKVCLPGLA